MTRSMPNTAMDPISADVSPSSSIGVMATPTEIWEETLGLNSPRRSSVSLSDSALIASKCGVNRRVFSRLGPQLAHGYG